MLSLASNGFNLLNIHGRAMRPIQVFTEVVRNKSQIVVITKENGIKRQMVAAIKQSLHLEKRSRQARHQV